jgi:hypothetical protein
MVGSHSGVSNPGQNSDSPIPCRVRLQAPGEQRPGPAALQGGRASVSMVTGRHTGLLLAGLGEGSEVTARPGSPGQLWPQALILSHHPLPQPFRNQRPKAAVPALPPLLLFP